jgi:hypothetical protein
VLLLLKAEQGLLAETLSPAAVYIDSAIQLWLPCYFLLMVQWESQTEFIRNPKFLNLISGREEAAICKSHRIGIPQDRDPAGL